MDPFAAVPQPVTDALARGWTVLTGNQRAARSLRYAFDLRQRQLGSAFWQPPAVLAWDSWLALLWQRLLLEGRESRLLLNSSQEHALWRDVIASDPSASTLRSADLADLAMSAWLRLHAWRSTHSLQAFAHTTDTRAFVRWAMNVERLCVQSRLLTTAQLPEALISAFSAAHLAPPSGLLLVGFDSYSPVQTALIESIRTLGTSVEILDSTSHRSTTAALIFEAPDLHTELFACARWLRSQLVSDPAAQLAVIVPDIDADRAAIERVLRHHLAPELDDIAATESSPLEFSLGIPLARVPLAAVALDLLQWAAGAIPVDRVSFLLLSPYFAAASDAHSATALQELVPRAEFDAFVLRDRPLLQPQISFDEFGSLVARSRHAAMPLLQAHLHALRRVLERDSLSRSRSHTEWSAIFQKLLDAAGWAPPAHLNSVEFQARTKWENALDELATLDFDSRTTPRVSLHQALESLSRIATQTLFAPESRHAPVQVLGPLESAGSSFDAIWFLRAGDLSWPASQAPNPLLPYALQRNLGMPGTDSARDLEHSIGITHRIAASAPSVLFSYARETPDGHQRRSPSLAGLAIEDASNAVPAADADPVPIVLDRLLDSTPVPAPPDMVLRGGASVLQAQAACAFRAFAERRLFSTALDSVSLGLDPRERGSLVHDVLHSFWREVKTQAALRSMTVAERDTLLAQCIQDALARNHARPADGWSRAYVDMERQRLMGLLGTWLDFEAGQRQPFVVRSTEEKLADVRIGPLRLDVRVDRVDQVEGPIPDSDSPSDPPSSPAEIILDYKTGEASPSGWLGDRPDAPQLPLYAVVSSAPHLAAIAFAMLRPGKQMGLIGVQDAPGHLPSATRGQLLDLEFQRKEWRRVLEALAADFHAGRALTSPKSYPKTCRYCRQRLLCRLDLTALTMLDDDGDDESGSAPSAGPFHVLGGGS
ncbi:MAG TPA: PD-(D/E)XK nuclease family protein [Acidobacteriaceae bacterium]|nr:PD-(D/E)XK nuclease family protein [Acidobacteriaceae bacterium]